MDNNKPFLAVQPSHETAYHPSLEVCTLLHGCCLLPGTAYDQSCSLTDCTYIT